MLNTVIQPLHTQFEDLPSGFSPLRFQERHSNGTGAGLDASLIDGRPPPAETGFLLESVGELQHTSIVAVSPHDLDADGQTFFGKSGWH